MFQTLYDLSIEIIGTVPLGFEVIYLFCTLMLFFMVLLPFITSIKIVYDLIS